MKCIICYKKAEVNAYGNSYCMSCYKKSPYFAEMKAKKDLYEEKKHKEE